MKFLRLVILATFASHLVRGGEDECIRQGVQVCIGILGKDVSSEEEECRVVRNSIECLRDIISECHYDVREKKIDVDLENLETFMNTRCQTQDKPNHAISLVHNDKNKCTEEKAKDCLHILSTELFKFKSEKCRLMRSALDCLKDTGDECLDDYSVHIRDLEKRIWRRRCAPKEEDIEDCPELLTRDYGYLRSPKYSKDNRKNVDCWTLIQVEKGKRIFVTAKFGDPWINNCTSDYIEAFDGKDRNSLLVRHGCGYEFFNSSSNSLLIHFHSDNSTEGGSYGGRYTSVDVTLSPLWDVSDEILEESTKCVEENAGYIFQCFSDETAAYEARIDFGYRFGNFKKCGIYAFTAACIVRKTAEKCEAEETWANKTMTDLLRRDADDCFGSVIFEVLGFQNS